MISVQLRPHVGLEGSPPSQQLMQIHGLGGVIFGDDFENMYLVPHQAKVGDRVNTCLLDAVDVGRKGSTAQHDALVGFVWGHSVMLGNEAGGNKPS